MADTLVLDELDINAKAPTQQPNNTPSPVPQSAQSQQSTIDLYQTGPSTSDQFIRRWSLTLIGAGGQTWSISDSTASGALSGGTAGPIRDPLRITFQTRNVPTGSYNNAEITIFNLARALHPLAGLSQLYNRVILQAGYQTGRFGKIFDGSIADWHQGRTPNLTEVYLTIHAQDNGIAVSQSVSIGSYKAGTMPKQIIEGTVGDMTKLGASQGEIVNEPKTALIRGAVIYGASTDQFRKFGMDYYTQNGEVTVYTPGAAYTAGETVTINAKTGLVGMAESIGPDGIEFTCLLNPMLRQSQIIILDEAQINVAQGTGVIPGTGQGNIPGVTAGATPQIGGFGYFVDPSKDGRYLVYKVEHSGDTRGNEWYSHVTCYPANAAIAPGSQLPYYNNGATTAQVAAANNPPPIPADPTGGSNYYQDPEVNPTGG